MKRKMIAVTLIALIGIGIARVVGAGTNDIQTMETFKTEYQAWREYCSSPIVMASSDYAVRFKSEHYTNLVAIGVEGIPYFIQEFKKDQFFLEAHTLWSSLTGEVPVAGVNPWAGDSILDWYRGGARLGRERFQVLYDQLQKAKAEKDSEKVGKLHESINCMGIYALPGAVTQLDTAADQSELVLIVEKIAGKKLGTPEAVRIWWKDYRKKLVFLENPQ